MNECVKCIHFPVCSRLMGGMNLERCEDFRNSANAEEVRHGHWIKITCYPMGYKCSECGYIKRYSKPYCEICGAKMDGKGEG